MHICTKLLTQIIIHAAKKVEAKQKQLICLLADEMDQQTWYICTMQCTVFFDNKKR